jgi:hypothetical protein
MLANLSTMDADQRDWFKKKRAESGNEMPDRTCLCREHYNFLLRLLLMALLCLFGCSFPTLPSEVCYGLN